MEFAIHIVVTAIALLIVSKLLRGFEVSSLFTAILAALILGVIHTLMAPLAEHAGRLVGGLLAKVEFAYPIEIAVLFLSMLAVNAFVLKLAAWIGPGFRISDFGTAMLAALLLVVFNALIGEAVELARTYLGSPSQVPPPG